MTTKEYRKIELKAVDESQEIYFRTIKISGIKGSTKYLGISEKEYQAIKQILLGKGVKWPHN